VRFEILGPVRAYRGAEPVDLGHIKQQAVLALLALRPGEPVPLHQIVAVLWNGDPPENGADIVQRYVGALRRVLDPSTIVLTDRGYVLRAAPDAVDAGLFRAALGRARAGDAGAAREALGLWRGEPLAGLTGPVFEAARARLHQERAELTEPSYAEPSNPEPSNPEPSNPEPSYAEPVDPWDGHDLFPPDPASMI
jgi:DNA-binding SARP family transcriptional activator